MRVERRKRGDALDAAILQNLHDAAAAAKIRVESLREQFQTLAAANEIPHVDMEVIAKHRCKLDIHEEEHFLAKIVAALRQAVVISQSIQLRVEKREQVKEVMGHDRDLLRSGTLSLEEAKGRFETTAQLLQVTSVDVVEAVCEWRSLLSIPLPFIHNGRNCILAMLEDALSFVEDEAMMQCLGPFEFCPRCPLAAESLAARTTVQRDTVRPTSKKQQPRDNAAEILRQGGFFPHTLDSDFQMDGLPRRQSLIIDTAPLSKRSTVTFLDRLRYAEYAVQTEYPSQATMWKAKVEATEGSSYIPLLRAVYDAVGSAQLPEHYKKSEMKSTVNSMRQFCHSYSREKKQRMLLLARTDLSQCYPSFSHMRPAKVMVLNAPHHLRFVSSDSSIDQNVWPVERQFLVLTTFMFLRRYFGQWEVWVNLRVKLRKVSTGFTHTVAMNLLRARYIIWKRYTRWMKRLRARNAVRGHKADVEPAPLVESVISSAIATLHHLKSTVSTQTPSKKPMLPLHLRKRP